MRGILSALALVGTMGVAHAQEAQQVTLWGWTWVVAPIESRAGSFSATRLNPETAVFVSPSLRKSVQAKRAIETATGCKVAWSTMTKDIRDTFYAPVTCN